MGLFKKKAKKEFRDLPELPKIPRLPELPGESDFETTLPQLPRYPTDSLNNKFSQNTIKEIMPGKKERMIEADEFVREQMMPEHLEIKPNDFARYSPEGKFKKTERERFGESNLLKNYETKREEGREQSNRLEFPYKMERPSKDLELRGWQEPKTKSSQVFIKIDKFEESLKIFELTKSKIAEMEKLLEDIKELKEKEEKELSYWMAEIQTIKNQTEKVEKDIFSKLE